MNLSDWARTWAIPDAALADLQARLVALDYREQRPQGPLTSEAGVQAAARVEASRRGWRLWRNNVGAVNDTEAGVHIRFGLANDSSQVNRVLKSGDLIGIRPLVIQPGDVGRLVGQFVSFECKKPTWKWAGTERELAQRNWANLVNSLGGEARFINDPGQL